jgi:precorrin-2/cobalt-factor-2 C20-methyltransferase
MSLGKLYGVGVGPGAPDLITLRALETLKSVPVLALPRSSDYGASVAWKIIKPTLGEIHAQERLFLTFPMKKDPELLRPAWDKAFARIGERLLRGQSVAFVTEGDPSLYSTFIYLSREAPLRWPGVQIEVVPGISSVHAVAAITGNPLADGQERIAIIPATYGTEDLSRVLKDFDTVVLMKIGPEMPSILAALEAQNLTHKAVFVSKATMEEQRIVHDLRSIPNLHGDCFAMVIVTRKERSGVLAGDVEIGPLTSAVKVKA